MKRKTLTLLAYGLPTLLVTAVMAFNIFRPIQVLPRIKIGPGFGLTSITERPISNETMRGKIALYSFTYTHCASPACTQLVEKMETVRERLHEIDLGDIEVELVTITIDPERDTPEVLAAYASTYNAAPDSDEKLAPWHFVTGADPELVKIMVSSGFNLYHEKVFAENGPADAYQFKFVPMAILIDGWGIIRSEYRQYEAENRLSFEGRTDIDPDIILRDIGLLAQEANNSRGLASAAYEAAHLFSCYPP